MSRTLTTLLCTSISALALAACGGSGGTSPVATPPPVAGTGTGGGSAVTPPPVAQDPCDAASGDSAAAVAVRTGDVSGVDASALLDFADTDAACRSGRGTAAQDVLLDGVGTLSWDPSHDQPRLSVRPGEGMGMLLANASGKGSDRRGDPLAVVGLNEARTVALVANPARRTESGPLPGGMQRFTENVLSYLTDGKSAGAEPFRVVLAHQSQSFYFPDQTRTRAWLDSTYGERVSYNEAGACNGEALAACADGADLVVIGTEGSQDDADAVAPTVDAILQAGTGVLYMHIDGGHPPLAQALLPKFGADYRGDQYWAQPTLEAYTPARGVDAVDPAGDDLRALLRGLEGDTLGFDPTDCGDHTCPDDNVYTTTVAPVLAALDARLTGGDRAGAPLFETEGRLADKVAVLVGDLYRAEAAFPMPPATTAPNDILRARFADHAQAVLRAAAPAWADLGNHGQTGTAVPRGPADVTLQARRTYRSAGVYARPGQTVRVTRTDTADVTTHVRANLVRRGATRWFGQGYTRPSHTSTPDLPIAPGQSVTFTASAGGPVFIRFGDNAGEEVSFTFENVARHPVWRSTDDDAAFIAAVDSGAHDWAEIVTDGFEVHSRIDRMQGTLSRGQSPSEIARLTAHNFTDLAHALAGYRGRGITDIDEIHGWAEGQGIALYDIDVVKHMNADQSLCGGGCSGNPYDAYWDFDPLGHGDLHELGHGLERSRLRFEGQSGHTITNPYSYYAKAKFTQSGGTTDCQSLPYRTLFDRVQAAARTDDPQAAMAAHDHSGWSYGAAVNYQTMMGAQALGILTDGRHLLGRLHVIERAFNAADDSDAAWAEAAAGLGFAGYSREDARALSANDWLLIATSHAVGRDMSAWFETWGHSFGAGAKAHVSGLADFPLDFHLAAPTAACHGFPSESVPIDGASVWPEEKAEAQVSAQAIRPQPDSGDACQHDGAR